jgi:hypothetical protein
MSLAGTPPPTVLSEIGIKLDKHPGAPINLRIDNFTQPVAYWVNIGRDIQRCRQSDSPGNSLKNFRILMIIEPDGITVSHSFKYISFNMPHISYLFAFNSLIKKKRTGNKIIFKDNCCPADHLI